jgi:hypothetical protein
MISFNPATFKKEIESLHYNNILTELHGSDLVITYGEKYQTITPRERALSKKFSVVPLWYLKFLIDANPSTIVDLGCGNNLFKPVIERLHGISVHGIDPDPNNLAADETGFFDSTFCNNRLNLYESVFSINAIHFVSLQDLAKRIKEFYSIVAPGGHGFLAFNTARMIEMSNSQWLIDQFGTDQWAHKNIKDIAPSILVEEYVRDQLTQIDIDFIVSDLLISDYPDEYMDGNVRLVFKK